MLSTCNVPSDWFVEWTNELRWIPEACSFNKVSICRAFINLKTIKSRFAESLENQLHLSISNVLEILSKYAICLSNRTGAEVSLFDQSEKLCTPVKSLKHMYIYLPLFEKIHRQSSNCALDIFDWRTGINTNWTYFCNAKIWCLSSNPFTIRTNKVSQSFWIIDTEFVKQVLFLSPIICITKAFDTISVSNFHGIFV